MTMTAADPRAKVLDWLRPLLPSILPGWSTGARISPSVTPSKFILVKTIGGAQTSPITDSATIAFQVWGPNGITDDYERTHAARTVSAHARRDWRGRRASAVIGLPDPTDPNKTISQITVTALFTGADE